MKLFLILILGLITGLASAEIQFVKNLNDQSLYSLQESFNISEQDRKIKMAIQHCSDLINDPEEVLGRIKKACASEKKIFSNAGLTACAYNDQSKLDLQLNFICVDRPNEYKEMDCDSVAECKYKVEMELYEANNKALSSWSKGILASLPAPKLHQDRVNFLKCQRDLSAKKADYSKDFKVPDRMPKSCQEILDTAAANSIIIPNSAEINKALTSPTGGCQEYKETPMTPQDKKIQACKNVGYSAGTSAGAEDLDKCLRSNIEADLITTCTETIKKFDGWALIDRTVACFTSKQSVAKVENCGAVGFPYLHQIMSCIQSSGPIEVIQACKESGIKSSDNMVKCIESGKSASKIKSCAIKNADPYDNPDNKIAKCLNKWF